MVSMRTIAIFLIACAAILFAIAIQKYYSAVETAKAVADQIQGVEFDSVALPIESNVCGFIGILMLVAGTKLLFESRHHSNQGKEPGDSLLR